MTLGVFIIYAAAGGFIENYITELRSRLYKPLILELMFITTVFNMGIGILLASHNYFNEKRKEGSWKVDKYKLYFLCIPALFLSLLTWMYLWIPGSRPILETLQIVLPVRITSMNIFQILFGYTLVTSFYKSTNNSKPGLSDENMQS
ncbi:hypothetical protein Amet_2110 [Alkaliphilus metalliredigens QYMF]|uniref:Uncharacterized protein n=1 Tax=Alkaliphilus metalliredigens (strain QYMF) TaxID=293826 RepID=A6TQ01_ALKMQ|nr:hypothetical protein [Alkaliphilus metalliredigens]ABR48269.1 hypothetical protein Amet_2110 [Alkaliphilus metalliredigens QYMF]